MEWYIVTAVLGAIAGVGGASAWFNKKLKEARQAAMGKTRAMDQLSILRARLRAIQDNGKPDGKGECVYVLQTPKGRFAKVTLPEV